MSEQAVTSGLRLSTPVSQISGVGPRRAEALARLDIRNISDLVRHAPLRYEQYASEGAIDDLPMEATGSTRGTIVAARYVAGRGGKGRFEATLEDHRARLYLVWFNASYLRGKLMAGMVIRVQGKVVAFNGYPQMVNPHWEPLDAAQAPPPREARLRPIYPATEDMPSHVIEDLLTQVLPTILPQVPDPLPADLLKRHNMPVLAEALRMMHQPCHEDEPLEARRRLAYNELLLLQLGIALKRHYNRTRLTAPALRWNQAIDAHIRQRFGFPLTLSQAKVVREIVTDLRQSRPMNRLLQGDVGAGKTVVALYALLMAVADRKQGALMAPTELLAEQHYLSITRMLEGSNVRLALLTAGQGAAGSSARTELAGRIERGEVDMVIGTQALLTQSVRFHDLAVVVVDEQHRFGVLQRAAFRQGNVKGGDTQKLRGPHYLVMTATPIPRTLSLTVFGDLDVSVIERLPPGRTPIVTRVVPPQKADEVYRYMATRLKQGRQAYVVVPTIEDGGRESSVQLKNVRAHVKLLQDKYCGGFRVGPIHGRLKSQTREAIMARFRRGEIQVLVATTVIEVGVDVPNATMMIVEHAERFGLAQLHQLRGRVGRGAAGHQSLCVFIAEPATEEAARRMAAIAGTTDGFKIAEQDLEIRGMGDFFGTRQHGLPPLRSARIPEDMDLLQLARLDATRMVDADPMLMAPGRTLLRKVLVQQYGDALGLIDVG